MFSQQVLYSVRFHLWWSRLFRRGCEERVSIVAFLKNVCFQSSRNLVHVVRHLKPCGHLFRNTTPHIISWLVDGFNPSPYLMCVFSASTFFECTSWAITVYTDLFAFTRAAILVKTSSVPSTIMHFLFIGKIPNKYRAITISPSQIVDMNKSRHNRESCWIRRIFSSFSWWMYILYQREFSFACCNLVSDITSNSAYSFAYRFLRLLE